MTAFVNMNDRVAFNEKLISEVEKRRILWDVRSNEYKNVYKKDQAWRAVGAAVGEDACLTAAKVAKRWKSLRDTFVRKKKESCIPRSGAGAHEVVAVRWPHFKQMLFLRDTLEYPETSGNLPPVDSEEMPGDAPVSSQAVCSERPPAENVFNSMYDDSIGDIDVAHLTEIRPSVTSDAASLSSLPSPLPGRTQNFSSSSSSPLTGCRTSTTSLPAKKKRAELPLQKEIDLLEKMDVRTVDSAEHFGPLVAEKVRNCPKELRSQMEIEILQVAAKYEVHQ
ncbi:uncharacterized protein LOC135392634 [Ornithodoros turicata]|uniref:uncharacterized protein LOC135392634 n=1 Tax=Ornithodoros turicata TaxID=34597 RepID=UPI0031390910